MPSPPSHTLNAALTAACAELAAAAQAMDTGPARDCLRGAEVIAITDPLDGLYAPADFLAARHTPHDPYAPYRGPFARSLGSLLSKPSSTTTAVEPPPRPLPPTPSRALARLIGRRPGRTGPPTPARERAGSASAPVAGRLRAYMERI
ncbi:hypothetical protein Q5752_005193 [Cryptotrichosporon argae]